MRARALCNDCRRALLAVEMFSAGQFSALDRLYSASGALLQGVPDEASVEKKARIFAGSSPEGRPVANQIQSLLQYELEVEVWNPGRVFAHGTSNLDA